jgi:hypothetical protein
VPISTLQFDRSEQTAIAITGVWAYSSGFEFFVTRLIRPDALGFDEDPVPGAPGWPNPSSLLAPVTAIAEIPRIL